MNPDHRLTTRLDEQFMVNPTNVYLETFPPFGMDRREDRYIVNRLASSFPYRFDLAHTMILELAPKPR